MVSVAPMAWHVAVGGDLSLSRLGASSHPPGSRCEDISAPTLSGDIAHCGLNRGCFAKDYRLGTGRTGQILIRHANIFHTPTWMEEWKRKRGPEPIRAVGFCGLAEGAGSQITTVVRVRRREGKEKSVCVINRIMRSVASLPLRRQ